MTLIKLVSRGTHECSDNIVANISDAVVHGAVYTTDIGGEAVKKPAGWVLIEPAAGSVGNSEQTGVEQCPCCFERPVIAETKSCEVNRSCNEG